MTRFTAEDRGRLRDHVLAMARTDERVTGGALVGSGARDRLDAWSDLDMTFGIRSGIEPSQVLSEFTSRLIRELGTIDYFDVHRGRAIYRVMLFANGLELDLSVAPEEEFGQLGPDFRLIFGNAIERPDLPPPSSREHIGWGWHHILHANSAINRGRHWQALFWINGLRDHLLSLLSIRHGLPHAQARGAHELAPESIASLDATLVRTTDAEELHRALRVLASMYIEELARHDPELARRIDRSLSLVLGPSPSHMAR